MSNRIRQSLSAWNKTRKLRRSLRASKRQELLLQAFGDDVSSVCVETRFGPFLVNPADLKIGKNLLEHGKFNELEITLLTHLSKRNPSSLLVVGSHIGSVVLPVAKKFDRVCCVEANPKSAELLRRNIALHRVSHVEVIEIAASNEFGNIEFLTNKVNSGGSKRLPNVLEPSYVFDSETIVVESAPLDSVITENYETIFIDIEGGEYFALQGMARLLASCTYLCIEFMPNLIRNVASVPFDQWMLQVPQKFDALYIPDANVMIRDRIKIEEFLGEKFRKSECFDQIVLFNSSVNPCSIGCEYV